MHPAATKAFIYATAIANHLIEKHGPQHTDKTIEHKFGWPAWWPRRARPSIGKFYRTASKHLEVTVIFDSEFFFVRLAYGKLDIPRTDEGDPIH